ncbi:MAG: hypothetical protein Q9218_004149 [Villophora microphyllina]
MPPSLWTDTYSELKEKTNRVTTWLVENARSPQRSSGGTSAGSTVSVKELLSLAESLLDADPPVDIHPSVIQAAQTAVAGRIRCSKWFSAQTGLTPDLERSNRSHCYFNKALQKILQILLSLPVTQPSPTDSQVAITMSGEQTQLPSFEGLTVEDPTDYKLETDSGPAESSSTAAARGPMPPSTTESEPSLPTVSGPEYTIEHPADEWLTALSCMLQDIHTFQEYIRKLCLDYKHGNVDGGTFSMTANTAVDCVGRMEAQFLESFPHFKGNLDYLDLFEDEARQGQGKAKKVPKSVNTDDIGQHVFSLARAAIEKWITNYNLTAEVPRTLMGEVVDVERTRADYIFLIDMLTKMEYLGKLCQADENQGLDVPLLDKLSYIAATLAYDARNGDYAIPLHAIFAGQIYLDMHHVLGDKNNTGFQILRIAANKHRQTIKAYQEFTRTTYANRTNPGANIEMERVSGWMTTWVGEDIVRVLATESGERAVKKGLVSNIEEAVAIGEPYDLFRNHPWLCGAIRFSLDCLVNAIGHRQWNYYKYPNPLAHVYNAALQEGFVEEPWLDMEKVLDMHPSRHIFIGTRPKKHDQHGSQYDFAGGISPVTFSKKRRTDRTILRKKSERPALDIIACASRVLFTYTLPNAEIVDVRFPPLEVILQKEPPKISSAWLEESEKLRQKWLEQRKPLSPIEMMDYCKNRLLGERDALRFNYLGLVQHCHHWGRKLVHLCYHICTDFEYVDAKVLEQVDHVESGCFSSGWLACMSYDHRHQHSNKPVVDAVAKLLIDMIKTAGDKECKALQFTYLMEERLADKPSIEPTPGPAIAKQQPPGLPVSEGKAEEKGGPAPTAKDDAAKKRMAKGLASLY